MTFNRLTIHFVVIVVVVVIVDVVAVDSVVIIVGISTHFVLNFFPMGNNEKVFILGLLPISI